MRLKIINPTGKWQDTKVVNAETGEALQYVTSVYWQMGRPGEMPSAVITVAAVQIETVTEDATIATHRYPKNILT